LNSVLATWLVWAFACVSFAAALSLLVGRSGWRRTLAGALGASALAAPLLAPEASVLRAVTALYLLWTLAKVIDLGRDPVPRTPSFRVVQALVLHDLRRDGFSRAGARPQLRLGLLVSAVLSLGLAVALLHVAVFKAAALGSPWGWVVRHSAGLGLVYFGVQGALESFEFIYRCAGLEPTSLHRHPILSRSIAEFWGRRWNRVVGTWLFATFYRPIALRGSPRLAIFAAFSGSATLHFYFTWAAVGASWALIMACFFFLQVPLLLLERRWHQECWPAPLRRAWTLGWLALTSPLFVAPTLAILSAGFT
jgi:hypothetical protein